MDIQQGKPILVYGHHRGNAQPIRYLLCYLQIQFNELHLDTFAEVAQGTPTQLIGKYKIKKESAPYLIHEGYCFAQVHAIMSYLCRRYNHQDLLGSNIFQKARINECLLLWTVQKSQIFSLILKLIEAVKQNRHKMMEYRQKMFNKIVNTFQFGNLMAELCRKTNSYIIGRITILDLVFMEECFYLQNMFKDLEHKYPIIKTMKQFKERFQKEEFYIKNQSMLNSFPVATNLIGEERLLLFKQLWLGDKSFIQSTK